MLTVSNQHSIRYLYLCHQFLVMYLLFYISVPSHAQTEHYIALRTEAGFASLLDNISATSFSTGGTVGVGADWMLRHRSLLFSAGLILNGSYTSCSVSSSVSDLPALDTEGDGFTYHVELSGRHDDAFRLEAGIPLLLGMQAGKFYFMVGPQIQLAILASGTTDAILNTRGDYERASEPLVNMPNHGFYADWPTKTRGQHLTFLPNLAVRAEIGGEITPVTTEKGFDVQRPRYRYYLSAVALYGLLNRHPERSEGAVFSIGNDEGIKTNINHIYKSDAALGARLNDLVVGLRFTILFPLPEKKHCVICNDY